MDFDEVEKQSEDSCHVCERQNRDTSIVCVVGSASDVYSIDESTNYNGYFFVLQGNLSPIDGKGPSEIGLDKLEKHLVNKNIKELILATNTTIEGEATAHYIKEMTLKKGINVSRLAFGLPPMERLVWTTRQFHMLLMKEDNLNCEYFINFSSAYEVIF